jgi:catechol 2,3-dioxygenase-like lactoylglutathione lyase family enzyme
LGGNWMTQKKTYRVAEVAIRVDDLEKASAFYQDVLGFQYHHSEPGVIFLEVGPLETPLGAVGHPQLFALFGRGTRIDQSLSTFDHIAFEIESELYDQELERFRAKDMVIHERAWPENLPWDGRSFFFRDPEGNVIEIIAANRSSAQ